MQLNRHALAAALAALLIAAPAATARPADTHADPAGSAAAAAAATARPADEHAYLTPSAARALSQPSSPTREELGNPTALAHPSSPHHGGFGHAVNDSPAGPRPAGPPTWPAHPRPITTLTHSTPSHTGAGIDWTAIAFSIAGGLLAIGAAVAITTRRRTRATA